jgi:hypothetical protein
VWRHSSRGHCGETAADNYGRNFCATNCCSVLAGAHLCKVQSECGTHTVFCSMGAEFLIELGLRRPGREETSGSHVLPNLKSGGSSSCGPSGTRGQLDMLLVLVFLELLAVSKMCLSRTSEQLPASECKVCSVCWASELYTECPRRTFTKLALTVPTAVATFTCTKRGTSCSVVQIALHIAKCCRLLQITTQTNSSTVSVNRLSRHSVYMLKNGGALTPPHHAPVWRA